MFINILTQVFIHIDTFYTIKVVICGDLSVQFLNENKKSKNKQTIYENTLTLTVRAPLYTRLFTNTNMDKFNITMSKENGLKFLKAVLLIRKR